MKRVLRPLFLVFVLAALLCVSAFAMDMSKDPDHPADGERVKYTMQAGATVQVKGDDNEKFSVTATGGTAGAEYVLFVLKKTGDTFAAPTQSNIIYINQTTADASGKIMFENVFPSELAMNEEYEAHVVGADKAFDTSKATFSYSYVTYMLGDVNQNDGIDSNDALTVLQSIAGSTELTDIQRAAADADLNGGISANDALFILQAVAGSRTLE